MSGEADVMDMIRQTTATPGITRLLRTPDVSAADALAFDGNEIKGAVDNGPGFGGPPSFGAHQGFPPPPQGTASGREAEIEHLRERVKHLERISSLQAKVIQDEQNAHRSVHGMPEFPQGLGSQASVDGQGQERLPGPGAADVMSGGYHQVVPEP